MSFNNNDVLVRFWFNLTSFNIKIEFKKVRVTKILWKNHCVRLNQQRVRYTHQTIFVELGPVSVMKVQAWYFKYRLSQQKTKPIIRGRQIKY